MLNDYFIRYLSENLPYVPTEEQAGLLARLSAFLWDDSVPSVFLLKGYAGTGKTSLVGALVRTLETFERTCVLLAPTGRLPRCLLPMPGTRLHDTQENLSAAHLYGRFLRLSTGA